MFDRCWLWRRRLSRRADGTLSPAQQGALQDHLAHCDRCRAAAQADQVLDEVLHTHTGMLDTRTARTLDDRVVIGVLPVGSTLPQSNLPQASWSHGRRYRQPPRSGSDRISGSALPLVYLVQIVGGGLTAAAVTSLFLVTALHPAADTVRPQRYPASLQRSEPPVPLESLLQTASPRAALLWTAPLLGARTRLTTPHIEPASSSRSTLAPARRVLPLGGRQRQTMLDSREILGS
jgi:hypothetical protein